MILCKSHKSNIRVCDVFPNLFNKSLTRHRSASTFHQKHLEVVQQTSLIHFKIQNLKFHNFQFDYFKIHYFKIYHFKIHHFKIHNFKIHHLKISLFKIYHFKIQISKFTISKFTISKFTISNFTISKYTNSKFTISKFGISKFTKFIKFTLFYHSPKVIPHFPKISCIFVYSRHIFLIIVLFRICNLCIGI